MSSAAVARQPVHAHLQELRRRLLWSTVVFLMSASLAYMYHTQIIGFLLSPLHQSLYYTTPSGGFEFLVRISVMVGLILAVPTMTYHLIRFVEPALSFRFSRRGVSAIMLGSLGLLVAGVTFGYVVILPLTLHFFGEFGNTQIKPLISANDYLSLVLGLLATFAVLFQLPLIILFINRITPLTPKKLMRYQKHVIIGSLLIALVLPFTYDPLTQFVMAVPIIGLYEVSIILVWLSNRKRQPLTEAEVEPAETTPPQPTLNYTATPRGALGPRVLDLRPKS